MFWFAWLTGVTLLACGWYADNDANVVAGGVWTATALILLRIDMMDRK